MLYEHINTSNSCAVASYMNEQIELTLNGTVYSCSKKQAQGILKKFFFQYPINSLSVIQQSDLSATSHIVYRYSTNNESFKLYISIHNSNSNFLIYQIIIESET